MSGNNFYVISVDEHIYRKIVFNKNKKKKKERPAN